MLFSDNAMDEFINTLQFIFYGKKVREDGRSPFAE